MGALFVPLYSVGLFQVVLFSLGKFESLSWQRVSVAFREVEESVVILFIDY